MREKRSRGSARERYRVSAREIQSECERGDREGVRVSYTAEIQRKCEREREGGRYRVSESEREREEMLTGEMMLRTQIL